MSNRTNECYVYFAFDGDNFEPNELTNFLGIIPTKISRKFEITKYIPKCHTWYLSTEHIKNELIDINELTLTIIDILKEKKQLILDAKKHFNLTTRLEIVLTITINQKQSTPSIYFDKKVIQFLSETNTDIDIDMYKH